MKKMNLLLGILFALFISYGSAFAQCGNCVRDGQIEHVVNETYSTTLAQAYYWEVCTGTAAIIGSNTNQTVTVECLGSSFTLKVTRFEKGICEESCLDVVCIVDPPECPPTDCLALGFHGDLQKCEKAWISFDPSCLATYNCAQSSIQLSLRLPHGSHQIDFPQGELFGVWYDLPPGNWNGTFLVGIVTITCGGKECTVIDRIVLDCYVGGEKGNERATINESSEVLPYQNEIKNIEVLRDGDQFSFNLEENEIIENVQIFNMGGQAVDFSLDKSMNTVKLNTRKTGVYKAIIITDKNMYQASFIALD